MLELQALPRRYGRTEATCEKSFPGSYATLLVPYAWGQGTLGDFGPSGSVF